MLAAALSLTVVILCMLLLIPLLVFAAFQSSKKRIGYIPLPDRAVPKVIRAMNLKGGTLYELGCGDGRILARALDTDNKLCAIGIEYNPLVVRLAKMKLARFGKRVQICRGDFMQHDLSPANYLFAYLSHPQMALLESKFDTELKKGTRLVSCDFPLPNRQPIKKIPIGEKWQLGQTLYIYDF